MLSPDKIEEFRRLMKEECGVDLTYEEAAKRASEFINLYRMLMSPVPEDPQAKDMPQRLQGGVQKMLSLLRLGWSRAILALA